jgi:hypothetical protein
MTPAPARRIAGLILGIALLAPPPVRSQVDCSDPDDLCTGDPCIIPTLEVASPCVVDFGSRTVVVAGTLRVPATGVTSLTAGAIDVQGSIRSRFNPPTGGPGIALDLSASGNIAVNGRIATSTRSALVLDAGGTIAVTQPVRVADFSLISMTAGGDIDTTARVRAGRAEEDVSHITLDAGGTLTVGGAISMIARFLISTPATINLKGTTGVHVLAPLRIGGDDVDGFVDITSGADVDVERSVMGGLRVTAVGDCTLSGSVREAVTITSATGDIAIQSVIVGSAFLQAPGAVTVDGGIDTRRGGPFADGGIVRIDGGSVTVNDRSINADGSRGGAGGSIRINATGGNAVLRGLFSARSSAGDPFIDGGVIECTATGDLVAEGTFRAAGLDGCIALSAGGTLDTTGATFDKPLSADCPGSPSGAFLEAAF